MTCEEKKSTTAPGRNSVALTWLAEKADGHREEKLQLVLHETAGLRLRREKEALEPGETPVCIIETSSCQAGRKRVTNVALRIDDKTTQSFNTDPEGWDAVFWTESAVEKFLYPYYHAHRTWDEKIIKVKDAFEAHPEAYAIRHKAPSASDTMSLNSLLEIGVLGPGLVPVWLSPDAFIELVTKSRAVRETAAPGAVDPARDNREPAAEPAHTPR
jgi:hypothetical protein